MTAIGYVPSFPGHGMLVTGELILSILIWVRWNKKNLTEYLKLSVSSIHSPIAKRFLTDVFRSVARISRFHLDRGSGCDDDSCPPLFPAQKSIWSQPVRFSHHTTGQSLIASSAARTQ